jgi:hypothetical protein
MRRCHTPMRPFAMSPAHKAPPSHGAIYARGSVPGLSRARNAATEAEVLVFPDDDISVSDAVFRERVDRHAG